MITNFNNHEYEILIKKNIDLIEKKYNVKVLFGAIVNSYAKGVSNNTSDLDFQFMFESLNDCLHKTSRICYYDSILELSGCEISLVLGEIDNYRKHNQIIPSYFYNRGRTIFARHTFIFRILSSDYIYGIDYIEKNKKVLYESFNPGHALDYFFSRAKDCEENEIQRDEVKVRQYIYILHDICSMLWIIEKGTIPPMKLDKLTKDYLTSDVKHQIEILRELNLQQIEGLEANKRSKDFIVTKHNDILDKFIKDNMEKIEKEIRLKYC